MCIYIYIYVSFCELHGIWIDGMLVKVSIGGSMGDILIVRATTTTLSNYTTTYGSNDNYTTTYGSNDNYTTAASSEFENTDKQRHTLNIGCI